MELAPNDSFLRRAQHTIKMTALKILYSCA